MTPSQLAKSGTEHGHQVAIFAYCAMAQQYGFAAADWWCDNGELPPRPSQEDKSVVEAMRVPELKWMFAIANGGSRGDDAKSRQIRGGQLKAEGVKSGVSDICLPVRRGEWSGLYIELKKEGGKPSPEQLEFGEFVKTQGYGFIVCYGWQEAVKVIKDYMTWGQ